MLYIDFISGLQYLKLSTVLLLYFKSRGLIKKKLKFQDLQSCISPFNYIHTTKPIYGKFLSVDLSGLLLLATIINHLYYIRAPQFVFLNFVLDQLEQFQRNVHLLILPCTYYTKRKFSIWSCYSPVDILGPKEL